MASLVGPTDQRSKIQTFNIAPTWTRLINPTLVFTLGGFVRHDGYNYYPSDNPFADLGPLQSGNRCSEPDSDERRRSDVYFLRERHSQREGGSDL